MAKILKSLLAYKPPQTENLIEFIRNGLRKNANHTLLVDSQTGNRWTGREIETTVARISTYLLDQCGLAKGDVCSLYGEESDRISALILGVVCAGGVSNFLTTKSSGREVHDTASVMNSKFLLTRCDLYEKISADLGTLKDNLRVICYDKPCGGIQVSSISCLFEGNSETSDNGPSLDSLVERVKIEPNKDFAVIQFSSGTTGKPKPIPRTHSNLCHLVASVDHEQLMDLRPGVVITGSLPITHRPGLWALLAAVHCGNTFVIWSNLSDVEDALATIDRYKVTIFSSSLPFLSMLGNTGLALSSKFDLSSLEHIITSGAKIVNPQLPASLVEGFGLKSLRQCFGMTESGWVFLIEQNRAKDNFLTVGHVVPGMEAVIMDRNSDRLLEKGERGEVALRGPQVFPGYLTDKPGLLNRSDFTEGGWFRIGDQGYYDENGLVFIEGRYKEVMMFENNTLWFPNEIEAIISEHPAVEGVCVVKIEEVRKDYPHDVARAYVTLKQGQSGSLNESSLIEFVQSQAPTIILGGGVRFLDKFPRLQNGKVDKQTLKSSA